MDQSKNQVNESTNDEKRKNQLEQMLQRLENQRNALNQVAEKQYEESGDLSGVVFCEEQDEFNRISNEISGLLGEIQTMKAYSTDESEENR